MNELLIDLDSKAGAALYEQIYRYIKENILNGRLSHGERLPSARNLAASLQVSRSTVDAAYAQLVSEGYLTAKRGSGYYVCKIAALYDLTTGWGSGYQDMQPAETNEKADWRCNFLPGQIDSCAFPYNAWRKCAKEALLELEARGELLSSGHPQGEYGLRRTIASYLYRARGVYCAPEQIIIGAGNEYLLLLLAQIIGKPCTVVMESPTYMQAYQTFCNIGYRVKAVPMDGGGMQVDAVINADIDTDTGVSLVYVMPSHQFPLGCVMPLGRRLQLLSWAENGPGRYIIEDDHDSEFRYKGKPIPSLQGMANGQRVVYLGTFSNSIMPSIRISYMALPPALLEGYCNKCSFYASTVSKIQQRTAGLFIEQGYFERHLNKMRGIYKGKHDVLLQLLKGKRWVQKIYGDHAGLHLAVEVNSPHTEEELINSAKEAGLLVTGLSGYYIAGQKKPNARPVLLLGFGNLAKGQIAEGVAILDACVRSAV